MNIRAAGFSILLVILLITQLPTMFCALSHSPDGYVENMDTTETVNKIEGLIGCITPTSAVGMFLFVVGGVAAALVDQR